MPSLAELARAVGGTLQNAAGSESYASVVYDSRHVTAGDVFVAISGHKDDGGKYIESAFQHSACAVICDTDVAVVSNRPVIRVPSTRAALAGAAWFTAGYPNHQMKLVGVTGTNGKTTVTAALAQLLTLCGKPTGVCGTLGMFFGDYRFDSDRTTAEAPELAAAFGEMHARGATHVAMEATSIGLVMHRLDELQFDVAVFTNLSRDHLDFHGTWDDYRSAKLMLFESSRLRGQAVINADDAEAQHFFRHTARHTLTYGISTVSDFQATEVTLTASGTQFLLVSPDGAFRVATKLVGQFNVYNTLAILAAAHALGIETVDAVRAMPRVNPVRGRAEVVTSSAPFSVLVDYAHTPDALEKILSTLRELTGGKLLCVVGAGGDRDRGKRPIMAATAEQWSDQVYLTSDNPRTEVPEMILAEMQAGLRDRQQAHVDPDRRASIHGALSAAESGDVVVIAGKGHETYQEIQGVKYPFDDATVAREWLLSHGYEA